MKVTTLFHTKNYKSCPSEEEMYLFLDEPDTSPDKKAFLNHCAICEPCLQRWNMVNDLMGFATFLPLYEPDPSIYSVVLEKVCKDFNTIKTISIEPAPTFSWIRLPGWRLAWAALFLVMTWSIYFEVNPPMRPVASVENLDRDISSIQEDVNILQQDLEMEFTEPSEDLTS